MLLLELAGLPFGSVDRRFPTKGFAFVYDIAVNVGDDVTLTVELGLHGQLLSQRKGRACWQAGSLKARIEVTSVPSVKPVWDYSRSKEIPSGSERIHQRQ